LVEAAGVNLQDKGDAIGEIVAVAQIDILITAA